MPATVGITNIDDRIGPIQECRFFDNELDHIYRNLGPIEKSLTFEGNDVKNMFLNLVCSDESDRLMAPGERQNQALSDREKQWLEEAASQIILRLGEYAYGA